VRVPVLFFLIGISVLEGGVVLLSGMAAHAMAVVLVGMLVLIGAAIGLVLVNRRSQR